VRQVFALSRPGEKKLPQLSSIAVFSATTPERPPANFGEFDHVLSLTFADVEFLSPELSDKVRRNLPHALTETQVQDIRAFIEALPAGIASVLVHCEGGYSPSRGAAVTLHQVYSYAVELHSVRTPMYPSLLRQSERSMTIENRRRASAAMRRRDLSTRTLGRLKTHLDKPQNHAYRSCLHLCHRGSAKKQMHIS
jgi:hypothetical protein